jgi:hypothetical protein
MNEKTIRRAALQSAPGHGSTGRTHRRAEARRGAVTLNDTQVILIIVIAGDANAYGAVHFWHSTRGLLDYSYASVVFVML